MEIIKAVIPAAGLGTRFLPYTKVVPKELLNILNKPAIQYIVEEGLASGINNFLMITSKGKEAIADYFDSSLDHDVLLKNNTKRELLASTERINRLANFSYIRQPEPLGLGHAVLMAKHAIGKEHFGVLLPDDLIFAKQPGLAQLIRVARQEKASVIAVQEVPSECVSSYGIIGIKKQITPNLFHVSQLIEKPQPKDAPTNLAIIGRYVLSPKIFSSLEELSTYSGQELQLTDGIAHMMHNNERVFAYKIQGTRYDIGTPVGWLKAVLGCALQDPVYAPHIQKFLEECMIVPSYNPSKQSEHMF